MPVAAQAQTLLVPTVPAWHGLASEDLNVLLVVLFLIHLDVLWLAIDHASVFHFSAPCMMQMDTPKHSDHTRCNYSIGHFVIHCSSDLRWIVQQGVAFVPVTHSN